MIVEDRAGHGPDALRAGHGRSHGARQPNVRRHARLHDVRDVDAADLSRHRPHQGAASRRQCAGRVQRPAGLSSARSTSTTSTCSAAPAGSPCRRVTKTGATSPTCSRSVCAIQAATRCRSARSPPCATLPGRSACRITISIRRPNWTASRRSDFRKGQAHRHHGQARGRDAAGRLRRRMDGARLPADQGRQHGDVRLRPGRGVRLPRAGRAVRKLVAAAGGDPGRADVSAGRDRRRRSCAAWTSTSSRRSASWCWSGWPARTRS